MRRILVVSVILLFGSLNYCKSQGCNDTLKWKTHDVYYLHFINHMTGKYTMGSLTDTTINTKEIPNFVPMGILVSMVDNSARTVFYEYTISNKQGEIIHTSVDSIALRALKPFDSMGVAQATNSREIDITKWDTGIYTIKMWIKKTSLDGEFCDSIKDLGSYTTHFRIVHGGNSMKQIASVSLDVSPNPATEQLNVACGVRMHEITLYNTAGQQMRQINPCGNEAQIPLSGLPRGLYLLKVQTDSGSAVRKVVVE
ncbi:MAG: T9SS type A sorting domain-containing protein [Bacteroidales bacterium]|nr:T9SS type A sorting domain-containing protein [Bacteroidales bacterium]MBR4491741.1 T9SS type A sorting domain-containing protein [Bacteroidales bacterium]MBR4511465.1 T9SS type A sorting domain-containing protein [Bacteroidales bacterium]